MVQHEEKQRLVGTRTLKIAIAFAACSCNFFLSLILVLSGLSDTVK